MMPEEIRAMYTGPDGYLGYRTNQMYDLEKQFDGKLIWVRRVPNYDGDMSFESEEEFQENWSV